MDRLLLLKCPSWRSGPEFKLKTFLNYGKNRPSFFHDKQQPLYQS